MEHVNKTLFYFFFADETLENGRAYNIHFNCLKYYAHIFDNAIFIISLRDINNTDLIKRIEHKIIDCGFKNVQFEIKQNTNYCESQPFFDEIIKKIDKLEGLYFFAHTKGVTNYDHGFDDSIDDWILGMYYLNLNFMDEMLYKLCNMSHVFYGAYLTQLPDNYAPNPYYYTGTFYWFNPGKINYDINLGKIKLPVYCHDRFFVERFPSYCYDWEDGKKLGSHFSLLLYKHDAYFQSSDTTKYLLDSDEEREKFKEYKQKMLDF